MERISLKFLIDKLNGFCKDSLTSAAAICVSRTNYDVEIEHWLLKLLERPDGDAQAIVRHYNVDSSRLMRDLTRGIDKFDRGNARTPPLSKHVVTWLREAWLTASVKFDASQIRSGFLLLALLSEESLARMAVGISSEFEKIPVEQFERELLDIVVNSCESAAQPVAGGPRAASERITPSGTPALDQFTIDLTAAARAGKIDPVLGRDAEIRQVIDILTRRRQNNPILTGEAGVGKTAIAEGLARRIAAGDVPPDLRGVVLRTLDLGLLQAGAGVKGEFENRLKTVIDEVKSSPVPVVLFIDEAHMMIGAGGPAGQADAANLLKPALARGELRTIAATTWAEYKKYFEQDAALARRFQVVKVEEPAEEVAVDMLRSLVSIQENHHKVRVLDEALVEGVRLSRRYISGRQLPDKAVSLLDTACARVALSRKAPPVLVEDCRRRVQQLEVSIGILEREKGIRTDQTDRMAAMINAKEQSERELLTLNERWRAELGRIREQLATAPRTAQDVTPPSQSPEPVTTGTAKVAKKPAEVNPAPEAPAGMECLTPDERDRLRHELAAFYHKLAPPKDLPPMVHICVDAQVVAEIVATWTGIPVGRMVEDEIRRVLALKPQLERRIIGQSHALDVLARRIHTARAGLSDPRRPLGVFLLVGPSGVGKTETAISLAELLYGGSQNMTTINMSEFKEEYKVSLLMGSPPGYIGYGEGGVLTEAVRRKPYSVVLLDEMEKAHPNVHDIFFQVFDKGILQDAAGRNIDFKNTLILMTSNAGTELITRLCADPATRPEPEKLAELLHPELLKWFKPAFLGRMAVIPYFTLPDDVMRRIVQLQLEKISQRIRENYRASFDWTPELVQAVAGRCTEVDAGARNVDHILNGTLLPELSSRFLSRLAEGRPITAACVSTDKAGQFQYEVK